MVSSILFIDDDHISSELSKRLLLKIKKDLNVQIQNDAQAALAYLKNSNPIDIIFLDLNMPGMDGIDFMREFRKLNVSSKIIILTSIGLRQETMQILKELGCSEVLIKPLSFDKINSCMQLVKEEII